MFHENKYTNDLLQERFYLIFSDFYLSRFIFPFSIQDVTVLIGALDDCWYFDTLYCGVVFDIDHGWLSHFLQATRDRK